MPLTEVLLIIDCPHCDARVDAKEIATYDQDVPDPNEEDLPPWPLHVTMLVCIVCNEVLLAAQGGFEDMWPEPVRIYPPEELASLPVQFQIPRCIRESLMEANRCLRAEAYAATAVMCGRAVEGLIRHFKAGAYIGPGLSELRSRGIIDGMLLQWGEELQRHRNIGAHAGDATISKDDALDLFDFALAICQYVFVLGEKFRKFRERTYPGGQCAATVQ